MNNQKKVLLTALEGVNGILARMIQTQFVEQGIVGQPFAIHKGKKNYAQYTVHPVIYLGEVVEYCFSKQQIPPLSASEATIPLWKPSNISPDIWKQAVSEFSFCIDLRSNIQKHLLPLLGNIQQDMFSSGQLQQEVKQALIKQNILMRPIRIINGSVFYFNTDQIYQKDQGELGYVPSRVRRIWCCYDINMRIWYKAVTAFREGMTLDNCLDLFFHTDICLLPKKVSDLERLVTQIEHASYERFPGNDNIHTFDRIRIHVNLSQSFYNSWEDLRFGIKEYQKDITAMVVDKIKQDHSFQRFGVPLGVLRLTNIILSRNYFLEYIFELKEIGESEIK